MGEAEILKSERGAEHLRPLIYLFYITPTFAILL